MQERNRRKVTKKTAGRKPRGAVGARGAGDKNPEKAAADNGGVDDGERSVIDAAAESPRAWAAHRDYGAVGLSEKDFLRLSALIRERFGINIKEAKKIMLEARLRRRLRKLDVKTFREYCEFLFSPEGMADELSPMIDEVTTNKTDFFREPVHFEYLRNVALPVLRNERRGDERWRCTVWSAGCSTGEEPYTLAMVLSDFAERQRGFSFRIFATDISSKVLEKAVAGIYDEDKTAPVSQEFRRKYLMRSRDRSVRRERIVPELRATVTFSRLNFFDTSFEMPEPMDVVFCRNVIIYFDRGNQLRVMSRICDQLRPGGYLFMGHSETLHGLDLPLDQAAPTIYRRL